MTLTFDWFLPTSGDGRTIIGRGHSLPLGAASAAGGASEASEASAVLAERPPDIEYLAQVAKCLQGHRLCGPRTPAARANWRLAGMATAERQLHFNVG